jgi:hypothetical protein
LTPYQPEKQVKTKRAMGVAQLVKSLHSKCKALSSNSSTAKIVIIIVITIINTFYVYLLFGDASSLSIVPLAQTPFSNFSGKKVEKWKMADFQSVFLALDPC